jgi:hypothetical protein
MKKIIAITTLVAATSASVFLDHQYSELALIICLSDPH